eukprot:109553_1
MATIEENLEIEIQHGSSKVIMKSLEGDNWEELPTLHEMKSTRRLETSCRTKVQDNIDSLWAQTVVILLVMFDLILGLTNIIKNEKTNSMITLIIIIIYIVEISLRIYAYGVRKYFTSVLDVIDFIAVLASLGLYIAAIYVVYALLVKILRWIRVIRTTYRAIFSRAKKIQKAIRQLQRSTLKGYRDEKYHLDISYITDHILIMSKPTGNTLNQFAKDALCDVKKFLEEKHGEHYRIYDLCVYDESSADSDEKQKHNDSLRSSTSAIVPDSGSALSIFPVNIDVSDGPNVEYNTFGPSQIANDFAFRGSTVLSIRKLFEFAGKATQYSDERESNVIIIQSTSGLGRCMFMTACLMFYYYPTASLSEIIKFIHSERIASASSDANELFAKFLPSQARYIRYFATLISHCYRLRHADEDADEEQEELERNLSRHIQHIHRQSTAIGGLELDKALHFLEEDSKWNFYHKYAMDMLCAKIGIVIKQIVVHNYFDEIDPYVNWEADLFKWKENADDKDRLRCVEYDTFPYGIDSKPGRNSALIKKFDGVKAMVLEQDFGIRIYKSVGNTREDREGKRKMMAQLILHSHFINLDDDQCITFQKNEIDFVNKDANNKHFPSDFHIVIKAKILRRKG